MSKDQSTLLINAEVIYSHLFEKNPFLLDQHDKRVAKFAKEISKKYSNITVFFEGINRDHESILESKNKLLQEHHKKRIANAKKLNGISTPVLASLLLQKYKINVLFSDEKDLMTTIYQYALHENGEVIILCNYTQMKSKAANSQFSKRITFCDQLSLVNEVKLSSSVFSNKGRYYHKKNETESVIIDSKTLEFWNKPIKKDSIPACLNSYKDSRLKQIKDNTITNILGSGAFILNELGNPYSSLAKLRQAVYSKLGVDNVVEEILTWNEKTQEHYFLPYIVKADSQKINELSYVPDKLFKLIFHNLEKTSNVLFTEFNNHVCSAFTEVLILISIVTDKDNFLELFKKYSDKIKPVEKTIISKVCFNCNKNFSMKESELEVYKLRDLPYPSTCQGCIDDKVRERKLKEEMEKNIAIHSTTTQDKDKDKKDKEKEIEKNDKKV